MTIKQVNDKYIVYLNKSFTSNLDFKNTDILYKYFIKIFKKISDKFNVSLHGLYCLNMYLDKYYGSIIDIVSNDNYYLDEGLDININVINDIFLYEIDYYDFNKELFDIYLNKNKVYLKIKSDISDKDMYNLLENSKIIYNTENVILSSKKI